MDGRLSDIDRVIEIMQSRRDVLAVRLEAAYTEVRRAFFMNSGNAPHAIGAAKLAATSLLTKIKGLDVALTELEKVRLGL